MTEATVWELRIVLLSNAWVINPHFLSHVYFVVTFLRFYRLLSVRNIVRILYWRLFLENLTVDHRSVWTISLVKQSLLGILTRILLLIVLGIKVLNACFGGTQVLISTTVLFASVWRMKIAAILVNAGRFRHIKFHILVLLVTNLLT